MFKGNTIAKLLWIAFLVVGVVLLVLGFQEYQAIGSKLGRALGKTPSREMILYLVGGGGFSLAGLIGILRN